MLIKIPTKIKTVRRTIIIPEGRMSLTMDPITFANTMAGLTIKTKL
jgi:hypothetical protein